MRAVTAPIGLFLCAAVITFGAIGFHAGAQADGHSVAVSDIWARATANPKAKAGGVFATLRNNGASADMLIGAETPKSKRAEIHGHFEQDGVMRMERIEPGVTLAPNSDVVLQPGGLHVMLMGLTGPLKEGDSFPLTLLFEKAGAVDVTVQIMGVGAFGPDGASMGHGSHKKHGSDK